MQNHPSIVQNIGGDQNRVVGGNIIHGDAHIHLHGDTHQHQPPGGQEMVESSSILDAEVEDMLSFCRQQEIAACPHDKPLLTALCEINT